jgi:D-3-phosphoglycerate dehydrogenase
MTYKVLSTSPTFGHYALEPVEYLKSHGCTIELTPQTKKLSEEDIIQKVKDLDAMIVGIEKITDKVLVAAQKVKIIAKHGAGVDNIDMKAASSKGIVVTSAPGANSDAVADLTIALFLAVARKIPFADRSIREGTWPRIAGVQLSGKVLGIVGLGQIGKKVARRASGFDMKVMAYDPIKDEAFALKNGITYTSMEEIFSQCDYISLHIPLTPSTQRLIGEKELGMMKKDTILVNISRGNIVNEEALYQALKAGKIRGAALDVFAQEPADKANPLLTLDNFIATPHMGGYTIEALRETGMICVRDIVNMLEGKRPQYVVNPEVLK